MPYLPHVLLQLQATTVDELWGLGAKGLLGRELGYIHLPTKLCAQGPVGDARDTRHTRHTNAMTHHS